MLFERPTKGYGGPYRVKKCHPKRLRNSPQQLRVRCTFYCANYGSRDGGILHAKIGIIFLESGIY